MLKMLKMMMFTSEELDGTSQSSSRSWVINQFSIINIPMMMIIIMIIKITIMMITSEELDDAPHHPGAWALSRMNSAGQHHKLLALANITIIMTPMLSTLMMRMKELMMIKVK